MANYKKSQLVDQLMTEFPEIENNATLEAMIKFVMDKKDVIKPRLEKAEGVFLPSQPKDTTKSKEFRTRGNDYFQKNELGQALRSYTESILYAPVENDNDNHCLALGYANRSAVLININCIQGCCDDVTRALSTGYPREKAYKLHIRKGKCLLKLGMPKLAAESFSTALQTLKDSDCTSAVEIEKTIDRYLNECSKPIPVKVKENDYILPPLFEGENPKFDNVSTAAVLKFSKDKGRFIQAKKGVALGSVLFVEKPFASILLPEFYKGLCFHCYSGMFAPIPCNGCCEIMFCSESCRDESWNRFHKFECRYLGYLTETMARQLAVRILLTVGLDNVVDMKNDLELQASPSGISGLNKKDEYKHSYYTIYHLQRSSFCLRTNLEMLSDVLDACQLMWHMQMQMCLMLDEKDSHKRLLTIAKSPLFNENKYFITSLIFRHVRQLICNEYAITSFNANDPASGRSSPYRIGAALYPSANMMNHSCTPNTVSSFYKGNLVVTAKLDIEQGSEIYTCYDKCHYAFKTKEERQTLLKTLYDFDCNCWACTTDDGEDVGTNAFVCKYCEGPVNLGTRFEAEGVCRRCKRSQNCTQFVKKMILSDKHNVIANKLQKELKMKDALREYSICLDLRKSCLYKNNIMTAITYNDVASCFAYLQNFKESYQNLHSHITIIKAVFGAESNDYASTLDRLTDLIFLLIRESEDEIEVKSYIREGLEVCREGFMLHKTLFGKDNPTCREFEAKLTRFMAMAMHLAEKSDMIHLFLRFGLM